MGTIGTFDSFTTARLGIYAAQHGLRVTGNNISNINTAGYTRQRLDQVSLKTGANDMYRSNLDNHVGNGALVVGINQIRDPYLDIRYRNITSDVGYNETMLKGLEDIASILDEVGKGENYGDGLLYAQLQKIGEALRSMTANPSNGNDGLVRTAAESLAALFNQYAGKLEDVRLNTEEDLSKQVDAVNEILTNIRDLNKSIRECELSGDNALEMRDERNRQIDALAEYMNINVTYSMEDVGAGKQVEKLTISLGNTNPDPAVETDSSVLIDGIYGTQISIPKTLPTLNPDFGKKGGNFPDCLYLKADGTGTNDVAEAEALDNGNYTVRLGKLLDEKNREWTDSVTTWGPAQDGQVATRAEVSYTLTTNGQWKDKDEIIVGNPDITIKIGTDISADDANNNPAALAKIVAAKLNEAAKANNAEYTVLARGADIVYRSKKAGAVGTSGMANWPTDPTFQPAAGVDGQISFGPAQKVDGQEQVEPTPIPSVTVGDETTTVTFTITDGQWYQITTVTKRSHEVTLDDNDLFGKLQATRELLTEEGEFSSQDDVTLDENATTKRGIPFYQKSLDLLARQFAKQYNTLNQGYMVNQSGNYIDPNGKELTLAGTDGKDAPVSKTNGLTQSQKENLINNGYVLKDAAGNDVLDDKGNQVVDLDRWLAENNAMKPEGSGVLFSNRNDNDDPTNITAANISVSHSWSTGDVHIVPTHTQLFGEDGKPIPNTTQSENIGHMLTMINQSLVYDPKDIDPDAVGNKLFTGSFNDMLSKTCTTLGSDRRIIGLDLNNSSIRQVELDSSREGVSGVDLNDEAMNMMQFQKAYSAACRLMTAIDEALDRLINNTGIAGR